MKAIKPAALDERLPADLTFSFLDVVCLVVTSEGLVPGTGVGVVGTGPLQ